MPSPPAPAAPIALRAYRASDLEAMYALDLVCFEPVFRFSRRAMRRFAEAPGANTLIADAGGELAGFCIVHRERASAYVVTLDVAQPWRGQGIARRLMAEAELQAQAAGGEAMELHVFERNLPAVRFYERLGYTPAGHARNFYARGMDALVYRKTLAAP